MFILNDILRALAGGALIGGATALLLLGSGRIAGVSGVFGRLTQGQTGPGGWRLAFIVGLVLAAVAARAAGLAAPVVLGGGLVLLLVAGAITGLGAGLANGCTSGHGVCGLSNLSLRSLVSVVVFMGTAGLTVFVVRHVMGGS